MKCTLRKVDGGIVATIDERPKNEDCFINLDYPLCYFKRNQIKRRKSHEKYRDETVWHKIIASTIPNVGKEIEYDFNHKEYIFGLPQDDIIIGEQYSYTETETQVIIEL